MRVAWSSISYLTIATPFELFHLAVGVAAGETYRLPSLFIRTIDRTSRQPRVRSSRNRCHDVQVVEQLLGGDLSLCLDLGSRLQHQHWVA